MTFLQRGAAADGATPRRHATPPGVRALVESKGRCAGCGAGKYRMLHEDGAFWIICPSCDQSGPREPSSYEALMSWRRLAGLPAVDMREQVRAIFMVLIALAIFVGLLGVALT